MTKTQQEAALRTLTKRIGYIVPRAYAVLPDGTVQMIVRNK
jgi:hypothetical protein